MSNELHPYWGRRWIEALRSGKYEEARGPYRSSECGFCAIGVLMDVLVQDGVVGPWEGSDGFYHKAPDATEKSQALAGLAWTDAVHWFEFRGQSFAQVADRLEAMLPPVTVEAEARELAEVS